MSAIKFLTFLMSIARLKNSALRNSRIFPLNKTDVWIHFSMMALCPGSTDIDSRGKCPPALVRGTVGLSRCAVFLLYIYINDSISCTSVVFNECCNLRLLIFCGADIRIERCFEKCTILCILKTHKHTLHPILAAVLNWELEKKKKKKSKETAFECKGQWK